MSFSIFQYELLVHTPNTDVYRRVLECRFTHFALYVALSLAHARGGSQHEEEILLLPPFTPRPYYVLWLVLPLFTYTRQKLLLPPFQFMAQFQNLSNQGRR